MTQISGKLVDIDYESRKQIGYGVFASPGGNVTIKLPEVDESKIRKGDEVWIRRTYGCNFDTEYIIAHFPQPEQPKVELPEEINTLGLLVPDIRGDKYQLAEVAKVINQLIKVVKQLSDKVEELERGKG